MQDMNALVVRLNARIANQREEIKHRQFVLEQVVGKASRLLTKLGVDEHLPITERLDRAMEHPQT